MVELFFVQYLFTTSKKFLIDWATTKLYLWRSELGGGHVKMIYEEKLNKAKVLLFQRTNSPLLSVIQDTEFPCIKHWYKAVGWWLTEDLLCHLWLDNEFFSTTVMPLTRTIHWILSIVCLHSFQAVSSGSQLVRLLSAVSVGSWQTGRKNKWVFQQHVFSNRATQYLCHSLMILMQYTALQYMAAKF